MIIETHETADGTGKSSDAGSLAKSHDSGEMEREFNRLAAEWKEQGAYLSSPTAIANLPAYQAIVAMGKPVLPLILKDLQKEPDLWFTALKRIAGESPVPESARGIISQMADAWLHWGRQHGIIA